MLEQAMPGEARLSDGISVENFKSASGNAASHETLQEMSEKLEKSEASRKKLRRAINMLKEQLEATEKVQQINETLRKECEKERQQTEVERKNVQKEKEMREQIEVEGLSTKDQLARVLERLDTLERNYKSDRRQAEQMRQEMKQAVSMLNGAVKAVEAAHVSFQTLEENILCKIGNAVSVASKSFALAKSAISDAQQVQGTATAADKLSQSLSSQIVGLLKQSESLDHRVNALTEELRNRVLPRSDEQVSRYGAAPSPCSRTACADTFPNRGLALSNSTNQTKAFSSAPKPAVNDSLLGDSSFSLRVGLSDDAISSMTSLLPSGQSSGAGLSTSSSKVGQNISLSVPPACSTVLPQRQATENPSLVSSLVNGRANHVSISAGHKVGEEKGPSEEKSLSEDKRPSGNKAPSVSSGRSSLRDALDAARKKKNVVSGSSSTNVALRATAVSNVISSDPKFNKNCGEEIGQSVERTAVDHPSGSIPASIATEKTTSSGPTLGATFLKEKYRNMDEKNSALEACGTKSCLQSAVDTGAQIMAVTNPLVQISTETKREVDIRNCGPTVSSKRSVKDILPVLLFKDLTKLYQKGKRSQGKVERKLDALGKALLKGNEDGIREVKDYADRKLGKRKRNIGLEGVSRKKVCTENQDERLRVNLGRSVATPKPSGHPKDVSCEVVDSEVCQLEFGASVTKKDSSPTAVKSHIARLEGRSNDVTQAGRNCLQRLLDQQHFLVPDVETEVFPLRPLTVLDGITAFDEVTGDDKTMNIDMESSLSKLNMECDSDSGTSEDWLKNDWWTTDSVLLSPTLPELLPPLYGVTEESAHPGWTRKEEMGQELALFFNTLPPVDEVKVCAEEFLSDARNLRVQSEDTQSAKSVSKVDLAEVLFSECDQG